MKRLYDIKAVIDLVAGGGEHVPLRKQKSPANR
jgi:hypothetical protein